MGLRIRNTFLLLCPSFDVQRQDLFAGIAELLRPVVQIPDLSNDALTQLLLYDDLDLSNNLNRSILELTPRFIHETGRFDRCKFFFTSDVRHFIYHNQLRLQHHSSYHIPDLASGVEQNLVHCH